MQQSSYLRREARLARNRSSLRDHTLTIALRMRSSKIETFSQKGWICPRRFFTLHFRYSAGLHRAYWTIFKSTVTPLIASQFSSSKLRTKTVFLEFLGNLRRDWGQQTYRHQEHDRSHHREGIRQQVEHCQRWRRNQQVWTEVVNKLSSENWFRK